MAEPLPDGTWVKLLEDAPGSVENYTGKRVPLTMKAGTLVTIDSAAPFIRELATRDSMSMPIYEHSHSFRCAMGTQWHGYVEDANGDVKSTSPIPHRILSTSPGGPVDQTNFYKQGQVLFLLKDHEYVKSGSNDEKGWIYKDDPIILTSNIVRSITVGGRINLDEPNDIVYCFQKAVPNGRTGQVIWKSDHYYVTEDAFYKVD